MFKIKFEVDGETVKAENMADALKQAMLKQVEQNLAEQVGEMRCPEHQGAPSVTVKGSLAANDMTLSVTSCCDSFGESVLDALGAKPDDAAASGGA